MKEVLRLAVAAVEPGEYAQNLGGALRRERRVDPREAGRVEALIVQPSAYVAAEQRSGLSSYGFTTIFPNIWLSSKYSCAARNSLSGKVRSTTGFKRPTNTCFKTSCSSPIVPM